MPILRFENVTKQFDTDSFGVREINFSVESGEFLFLTGPSGSGKTTLMRLLLKEYPFNTGEIFFQDNPLSTVKNSHVHLHRRRIGVVFQDYKLISEMNIWENIAVPLWVTGKSDSEVERRVTDLLNLIKLPEKALHFPSQLSGGEAQRVGIARALAIGPELVIADEPTGNLDPETAQNVARLLKKINELGTTVVIATHDKNILAAYPDTRKIALEKGALVHDTKAGGVTKKSTHRPDLETLDEKAKTSQATNSVEDLVDVQLPKAAVKTKHSEKAGKVDTTEHTQSHKHEQRIAEDLNHDVVEPPEKTDQDATAEKEVAAGTSVSTPWWKKIFGSKPKSAPTETLNKDSAKTAKNPDQVMKKVDESEKNFNEDDIDTTTDDLVTITEEALDADEPLEKEDDVEEAKTPKKEAAATEKSGETSTTKHSSKEKHTSKPKEIKAKK